MRIKIINLAAIAFCLFILQSCLFSNCNEIDLSKDDKAWINYYNKAETLIFKSDLNNIDTFLLEEKYEAYTNCTKVELGPDVYNYIGISFLKKGTTNKLNNKIIITIEKDFQHGSNTECIKTIRVFDLSSSFDSIRNKELIFEHINLPVLNINPIKTYFFEVGDSFSDNSTNKIQSFNWSKQFGLVKYKLKTGESYYLKNNKW